MRGILFLSEKLHIFYANSQNLSQPVTEKISRRPNWATGSCPIDLGAHPKQHGWQLGINGRLASGEAFRATFGEILASRKNRVKLRDNACLN
jgi:hypothetical protein